MPELVAVSQKEESPENNSGATFTSTVEGKGDVCSLTPPPTSGLDKRNSAFLLLDSNKCVRIQAGQGDECSIIGRGLVIPLA